MAGVVSVYGQDLVGDASNSSMNITEERAEILRKRKERKIQKRKERKAAEQLTAAQIETALAKNESQMKPKSYKFKNRNRNVEFNLLDYIVEKNICNGPIPKQTEPKSEVQKNKGKKREIPRQKTPNPLKRTILKNRAMKVANKNTDELSKEEIIIAESLNHLELEERIFSHSRKFRPYCDNTTSPELCNLVEQLLRDLHRFQKNAYLKSPIKSRTHRRYVLGFNEVKKHFVIKKIKLVIIAPDCEACEIDGGLDETINGIKEKCKEDNIEYLFGPKRRELGYFLFKRVAINCIGILSYDGAHEIFNQLIDVLKAQKEAYKIFFKLKPET